MPLLAKILPRPWLNALCKNFAFDSRVTVDTCSRRRRRHHHRRRCRCCHLSQIQGRCVHWTLTHFFCCSQNFMFRSPLALATLKRPHLQDTNKLQAVGSRALTSLCGPAALNMLKSCVGILYYFWVLCSVLFYVFEQSPKYLNL